MSKPKIELMPFMSDLIPDNTIRENEAMTTDTDCKHESLYPLLHSDFGGKPGTWTHCNNCGSPVEITQEMENRWADRYREAGRTLSALRRKVRKPDLRMSRSERFGSVKDLFAALLGDK
jgi:hypothetical protein